MRNRATVIVALLAATSPLAAQEPQVQASAASAVADRGANISVAPLHLELDDEEKATTLRLRNPASRQIGVQVRIFAWDQVDGEDIYTPTTDAAVSPSIIKIQPGDTQIFRVVRNTPMTPSEKRYRVVIDQLPDPSLTRHGEFTPRLRFTLPLMIDSNAAAPAQLAWQVKDDRLVLNNAGGQTVRIATVAMKDANGNALGLDRSGLRYVMGNKTASWTIHGGCPAGTVEVAAVVDGEETRAQAQPNCG